MKRAALVLLAGLFAASPVLTGHSVFSQVSIDIDANQARRAVNETILEDLAVNDTAYVYGGFCVKDGALYIPGWVVPTNYSTSTYTESGVTMQVRILPGKRLSATFVDARQAQLKAQGNPNAGSVLSKEEYDKAVRERINRIFQGGGGLFAANLSCDDTLKFNPLRKTDLYAVDSLNGHKKLSELLASVTSTQSK